MHFYMYFINMLLSSLAYIVPLMLIAVHYYFLSTIIIYYCLVLIKKPYTRLLSSSCDLLIVYNTAHS